MKSWRQIQLEKYDFDEESKVAACVSILERSHVIDFVKTYLLAAGPKTRRIVSSVYAPVCPAPARADEFRRADYEKFHQTRPLYPSQQ
jgi:secreted Zn-dependent insulinase-like peptidase